MATTIKVNGQTITIADKAKTATATVEASPVVYDEYECLAKATESAVLADVMGASFENYCQSLEAVDFKKFKNDNKGDFKEKASAMGEKMKLAAQKIWTTIADFFRDISHYIITFVNGKIIQMHASALLKKIKMSDSAQFKIDAKVAYPRYDQKRVAALRNLEKDAADIQTKINKLQAGALVRAGLAVGNSLGGIKDGIAALFKGYENAATVNHATTGNGNQAITVGASLKLLGIDPSINGIQNYLKGCSGKSLEDFKVLNEEYKAATENEKSARANAGKSDKKRDMEVDRYNISLARIKVKIQQEVSNLTISKIKHALKCIETGLMTTNDRL